jgi:hypothetical protein
MSNTPERPAASPSKPRKARHLIDFDAPRAPRDAASVAAAEKSLSTVQQWVLSVLSATTILHLAIGIVIAAIYLDRPDVDKLLLCVIAGAFGIIAGAVARAIHQVRVASPWLLVGLLPGIVGAVLVLR